MVLVHWKPPARSPETTFADLVWFNPILSKMMAGLCFLTYAPPYAEYPVQPGAGISSLYDFHFNPFASNKSNIDFSSAGMS